MACVIPDDVIISIRDLETLNDRLIHAVIVENNKLEFRYCKPSIDNPFKFVFRKFEDTTMKALQDELFSHRPCYIFLRCVNTHDDGTVSYPLFLVHYDAKGAHESDRHLFTEYCPLFLEKIENAKKLVIEDEDDLNEEWLREQLNNV